MALAPDDWIYREIVESLPTGVYLVDRDRKILMWNSGAEAISGYKRHEILGRYCQDNILAHCDANSNLLCGAACPLAETMLDGKPRQADVFLRHKDGELVPVRVRAVPIRNEEGMIIGAAESFEEIPAPEPDELLPIEPVHDNFDAATGIPDHPSMVLHLRQSLDHFHESQVAFGVFSVAVDKLDHFKETLGKKAVEAILRVVARTLSRNLHPADAGRWSQDRLLAVAANCPPAALSSVAWRLKKIVCAASVQWWGDRISFTISMGATGVRAEDTVDSLVERCAEALETSLAEGGDQVTIR